MFSAFYSVVLLHLFYLCSPVFGVAYRKYRSNFMWKQAKKYLHFYWYKEFHSKKYEGIILISNFTILTNERK